MEGFEDEDRGKLRRAGTVGENGAGGGEGSHRTEGSLSHILVQAFI